MTKEKANDKKKPMNSEAYIQALLETIRIPFLILDSKLMVMEASPTFCESFKVTNSETQNKQIYQLGNGQWDIPELKKLLEEILPLRKTVNDYEVSHDFPDIGHRVMLLNANQIDSLALIILSFEDITTRRDLEKKVSENTKDLTGQVKERTEQLSLRVRDLERLNESMVGRELKMVELKKEVETLKKELKAKS